MPFKSSGRIFRCKYCDKPAKINMSGGRHRGYYRTCGAKECLSKNYKDPEVIKRKIHLGKENPRWIEDRTKIKQKRMFTEERWFVRDVMEKRGFKCELTGGKGQLSVHHIKPVWEHKELIFNESNVVVIKLTIHKLFHNLYGLKSTEEDWNNFVREKQYVTIC